jgi:RNA-directed DNA polymerase
MRQRMPVPRTWPLRGRGRGYRRCRPSCIAGRWPILAAAFSDLFNLLHDPATLKVAWQRVAGNTGARSAGVDGLTAVGVEQDLGVQEFLDDLRSAVRAGTFRPLPVRERMIPKPGGSGKLRRLGIPTIADRALQAVVLGALEPEWEVRFEPKSYGFRPGRGCHDAIEAIFCTVVGRNPHRRWILDADLAAAFDRIDHQRLLAALGSFPARDMIASWLKAGVIENGTLTPTREGTPQGALCSAEHNAPYEQCRVMRSAESLALVTAALALDHCA